MLIHRRVAAIIIAVVGISFSIAAQTPRATLYVTVKNAKGETRKGIEVSVSDKKRLPHCVRLPMKKAKASLTYRVISPMPLRLMENHRER
ncbi:MAG: hypothetical protein M0D57_06190 [Sphingobacteriales bacterium JAD_PAG50586_3]|nr:MAG: hypothetical protein M0D57_06190 [Sphingobacteriales bacterium JAD_PAG50586_3]